MITEDQTAVIEFLSSIGDPPIERIDTHISVVFLSGKRALKLKRAGKFDYLDFSTPERRKTMCGEEVRLNRRTAPGLYRGVLPVTRESNGSQADPLRIDAKRESSSRRSFGITPDVMMSSSWHCREAACQSRAKSPRPSTRHQQLLRS